MEIVKLSNYNFLAQGPYEDLIRDMSVDGQLRRQAIIGNHLQENMPGYLPAPIYKIMYPLPIGGVGFAIAIERLKCKEASESVERMKYTAATIVCLALLFLLGRYYIRPNLPLLAFSVIKSLGARKSIWPLLKLTIASLSGCYLGRNLLSTTTVLFYNIIRLCRGNLIVTNLGARGALQGLDGELSNARDEDGNFIDPILNSTIKKEWANAPRFIKLRRYLFSLESILPWLFRHDLLKENVDIRHPVEGDPLTREEMNQLLAQLSCIFHVSQDQIMESWHLFGQKNEDDAKTQFEIELSQGVPGFATLTRPSKVAVRNAVQSKRFLLERFDKFLDKLPKFVLSCPIHNTDQEDPFTLMEIRGEMNRQYGAELAEAIASPDLEVDPFLTQGGADNAIHGGIGLPFIDLTPVYDQFGYPI